MPLENETQSLPSNMKCKHGDLEEHRSYCDKEPDNYQGSLKWGSCHSLF